MVRTVKDPEERRREIIEAAKKLFTELDYEATTMQALMKMLKVAKGTIYHYFASKEELLEAVVENLIDQDLAKKEELFASASFQELDAVGKFAALMSDLTLERDNADVLEALHRPGNAVVHNRQLGRYINKLAPYFARVFAEGREEGVFKTETPLESAEMLLAGIQFITDVGFYPWSAKDVSRRNGSIQALVEAQLGAPRGSLSFLSGRQ